MWNFTSVIVKPLPESGEMKRVYLTDSKHAVPAISTESVEVLEEPGTAIETAVY